MASPEFVASSLIATSWYRKIINDNNCKEIKRKGWVCSKVSVSLHGAAARLEYPIVRAVTGLIHKKKNRKI